MKRIISALLTFAMLLTLITVPMMVTANAWDYPSASVPVTMTNTTQMINTDAKQLYALKGTPTIDGEIDAMWANAYTLRYDQSQNIVAGSWIRYTVMADVYVMWDADNLYILEVREYDKPTTGATNNYTGGKDASLFYIVLPNEVDVEGSKYGAVNMPHIAPGDTSVIDGETVTAVASSVFARIRPYKTNNITDSAAAATNSYWTSDAEGVGATFKALYDENVTSYTALTDNGFLMETAIPWDILDEYNSAKYVPAVGDQIGFNFNPNDGCGNGSLLPNNGDHMGYMGLQLVENTNPTVKPIIPDLTWINDPNCITDDGYYMISDAADLLGLAFLSLGHGSHTDYSSLGITSISAGSVLKDKKFRIMNDIDLNPGWDANSSAIPTNAWPVINQLNDAEIDGNGKTISGLYNVLGVAYSDRQDGLGFIGRMAQNVYIHDLTLTNGKFIGDSNDSVGSFAGLVNSNGVSGNSSIVNCSSDMILGTTNGKPVGGIIGGNWTGNPGTHNLLIENCVFTGTAANAIAGQGKNGATLITQKNNYSTVAANKATIEGSDAAAIQATPIVDGKFDVRILGLIDEAELDLDAVGMKVTVTYTDSADPENPVVTTYQPLVTSGKKVFKTITANGTPIEVSSISAEAEYAYGAVLTNVPAGATDTVQITVVLTRTIDGVAVESTCAYSATYIAGAKQ